MKLILSLHLNCAIIVHQHVLIVIIMLDLNLTQGLMAVPIAMRQSLSYGS